MTKEEKDAIAQEVRDTVNRYWPDRQEGAGSCIHHSLVGLMVLHNHGIDAQIQAGGISWPIIDMDEDDGVCNTHFSMLWEPDHPNSVMSMMSGGIPELHSWLGIPETQELIDFSTHELKDLCTPLSGETWRSEDPPEYLWEQVAELPADVVYVPSVDAISYVKALCPGLWSTRKHVREELGI